jgi:hypothetical protein
MKLWGLKYGQRGCLMPIACRTRAQVMEWCAQRFIGAQDYKDLPSLSARWKLVKRRHPNHRIVRVTVSEEQKHG